MLQRNQNTLSCPSCGQSWSCMAFTSLQAGSACPDATCASNKNKPLGIVHVVCNEFGGNGLASIGAIAALSAMSVHWVEHLGEGHNPNIILSDIDELTARLTLMRAAIEERLASTRAVAEHHLAGTLREVLVQRAVAALPANKLSPEN